MLPNAFNLTKASRRIQSDKSPGVLFVWRARWQSWEYLMVWLFFDFLPMVWLFFNLLHGFPGKESASSFGSRILPLFSASFLLVTFSTLQKKLCRGLPLCETRAGANVLNADVPLSPTGITNITRSIALIPSAWRSVRASARAGTTQGAARRTLPFVKRNASAARRPWRGLAHIKGRPGRLPCRHCRSLP